MMQSNYLHISLIILHHKKGLQTHFMDTNDVGNGDASYEEGIIADMIQMTMMHLTQKVNEYRAYEEVQLDQNTTLLQSNDLLLIEEPDLITPSQVVLHDLSDEDSSRESSYIYSDQSFISLGTLSSEMSQVSTETSANEYERLNVSSIVTNSLIPESWITPTTILDLGEPLFE